MTNQTNFGTAPAHLRPLLDEFLAAIRAHGADPDVTWDRWLRDQIDGANEYYEWKLPPYAIRPAVDYHMERGLSVLTLRSIVRTVRHKEMWKGRDTAESHRARFEQMAEKYGLR